MSLLGIFAVLVTLAAVIGFVNRLTLCLPTAIAVTLSLPQGPERDLLVGRPTASWSSRSWSRG